MTTQKHFATEQCPHEDEIFSIDHLKEQARMVLRHGTQKRFEHLFLDAVALDASEEELTAALMYVINTHGDVVPLERFLVHVSHDDDGDDEEAALKTLWHVISDPEFPAAIQAHPEWGTFLV